MAMTLNASLYFVMAGLVPAIHALLKAPAFFSRF